MKRIFWITLFCLIFTPIYPANALYGNYDEFVSDILPKENSQLIIPKGSFFRGILGQDVSSEFNNEGDQIKIFINSDFVYDNKIIVPKNTMFIGQVTNLEKAQQGRNGYFSINIIAISFPDNRQFAAKGYVIASKNNKIFGGAFARRSGYKTTLHRSACFKRPGTMELLQNGPRIMGEETLLKMGTILTLVLEEPINVTKL